MIRNNMTKRLREQLKTDFPYISTGSIDAVDAVVWLISGGKETGKTFDQIYNEIVVTARMQESPKQTQDKLVYTTLLELGRHTCQNRKLVHALKKEIHEIISEVVMKLQEDEPGLSDKKSVADDPQEINKGMTPNI